MVNNNDNDKPCSFLKIIFLSYHIILQTKWQENINIVKVNHLKQNNTRPTPQAYKYVWFKIFYLFFIFKLTF